MKLQLKDGELELKYSFRINVYFEDIQGKPVYGENFSANDLITLFYCAFITSLQKAKKPIMTMVEFLDVIDDNGGEKVLNEFGDWYSEQLRKQMDLANSLAPEVSDEEKKTKEI